MNANLNYEIRDAVACGQALALRDGSRRHLAASPEVEAKLSRLAGVAMGMFAFSMTAIVTVGVILF